MGERDLRNEMLRLLRDGYGPGGGYYQPEQRLPAAVALLECGWGAEHPTTERCAGFEPHPWSIYADEYCVAPVYEAKPGEVARPRFCGRPRSEHLPAMPPLELTAGPGEPEP